MSIPAPSPSSSSPSPTSSGSSSGGLFNNSGNLTSLYLYTFIATLSLLLVIFGALVARSIHLRRRRNAAFIAAIAAGTYIPPLPNGKRRIDPLLPEPALWEVHITPPHDPEKGWAEMLPVAGATLVPVTRQTIAPLRRASWHPGWLSRFGRGQSTGPPAAPEDTLRTPPAAATTGSLETPESSPPPPPPEPVSLAVLISMPTRTARGRAENDVRGPPVVEFGVAHVSYADPAGDLMN
ncbi:hypothetical protein V8E53_000033 [Lactarius tabidus]